MREERAMRESRGGSQERATPAPHPGPAPEPRTPVPHPSPAGWALRPSLRQAGTPIIGGDV
jgi:hypothetical protein